MREENEKKAQIVQKVCSSMSVSQVQITNTSKIKRMTKKQLRKIEKR